MSTFECNGRFNMCAQIVAIFMHTTKCVSLDVMRPDGRTMPRQKAKPFKGPIIIIIIIIRIITFPHEIPIIIRIYATKLPFTFEP